MMPHIIPGGRQRASSDGDVLEDEDDTINASGILDRLTEAHRNVSRSAILSTTDDDRDSDGPRSVNEPDRVSKNRKKTLRNKISFKSVKKAVKDTLFGSASSLNKDEMPASVRASSAAGVWTPTLRRRTTDGENDRSDSHQSLRSNREGGDGSGIDSVSRPLVTDPTQMIAKWERTPGNVGLFNHGNTCFMNAVIQCLSHTDSFTEYFVTDLYKDDLKNSRNVSKKQGSKSQKGDVTEQLGLLLKCLWSEKYNSEISIDFKAIVGKFNNQYKGSSQHDAQEFLLWLLDRVHEDVALPPPPISKKKTKHTKTLGLSNRSQTDEELAEAAESGLTNSFVSQLFQGLHRSSLTCPHCGRHSNTFDPYLCVSLPLPQKCMRPVYVVVVTLQDPQQSVMIGLSLNMYDTIRELREAVSNDIEIPVEQIVLCELTKDGFYATYSNEQPLSDIPENCTVYAIEMHAEEEQTSRASGGFESGAIQLLLLHVERRRPSNQRFCLPEVVQISRQEDAKGLQREILRHMGSAVKKEVLQQNLRPLFQLQIVDGSSRKSYLPLDVDMPLYAQTVDRVLSMFSEEFGPQHLKLIVEWEPEVKEAVIEDDMEHVIEHQSVATVRTLAQQPVKVSLDECFQLYTQEEKLAGEDAWLCPHCKKAQKGATKTLGLWSLPDVLILHLKRFKQTGMRRNKLNTLVEFPVEDLDMTTHVVHHRDHDTRHDNMIYDLIGVANHYGNMMGGHYTAYCKNSVDGAWHEFDDRNIRLLTSQHTVSKSAYILFYQRRSLTKAVNQQLHTGRHWIFNLQKRTADKSSSSPQRRRSGEEGGCSPVKKAGGIQEDLEHVATTPFERRVFSKEWNGQSSPTRRIPSRPLTPQPQKRPPPVDVGAYDQNTSMVIRQRPPSFRASRPTLSRQLSDAALKGKKHLHAEAEGSGKGDTKDLKGEARYIAKGSGATSPTIQAQVLQVSLPPKSTLKDSFSGTSNNSSKLHKNSEILQQPEQVRLPSPRESARPLPLLVQSAPRVVELPRDVSQNIVGREVVPTAGNQRSSSPHINSHPSPPVDTSAFESGFTYRPQGRPLSSSSSQRDSFASQSGRTWQYESVSSHSSRDTQSSQDSQPSPRCLEIPRSPQTVNVNGNTVDYYDWRQPDRLPETQISGGSPAKPAMAVLSRVMNKPPLPPKILTRAPEARSSSESSSSSSPLHKQDDRLGTAAVTPSLTSPPSPAPKDSQRQLTSQSSVQAPLEDLRPAEQRSPEKSSSKERFIALSDPSLGHGDLHVLKDGGADVWRKQIRDSQIPAEQILRIRRSQIMQDQKFHTIARGNRDARSEPREMAPPAIFPRSSTDHSIHFNNFGRSSPSHLSSQSPMHAAYPVLGERAVRSSISPTRMRREWVQSMPPQQGGNVPLYAQENQESEARFGRDRHQVYRGPMFQRPPRLASSNASNIPTPNLRESSV